MATHVRSTLFFALAVVVLAGSAIRLEYAKQTGSLTMIKKAIENRVPMHDLDRDSILPFEMKMDRQLPPETVAELGTEDYVDWLVQRTYKGDTYEFQLSVTYYTGIQDQLPHVPEECYIQGAFSLNSDEREDANMPRFGQEIPIRIQAFDPPKPTGTLTYVIYSLCVNGDFYVRREWARNRMADPSEKYLYYCKVDVSFDGRPGPSFDTKRQLALELYDLLLVELRKSHWPPMPAD